MFQQFFQKELSLGWHVPLQFLSFTQCFLEITISHYFGGELLFWEKKLQLVDTLTGMKTNLQ